MCSSPSLAELSFSASTSSSRNLTLFFVTCGDVVQDNDDEAGDDLNNEVECCKGCPFDVCVRLPLILSSSSWSGDGGNPSRRRLEPAAAAVGRRRRNDAVESEQAKRGMLGRWW